jgi:hypothetical protein
MGGRQCRHYGESTMTDYFITFLSESGETLGTCTVSAWSHWDACEWAWENAPAGTSDFDCITD